MLPTNPTERNTRVQLYFALLGSHKISVDGTVMVLINQINQYFGDALPRGTLDSRRKAEYSFRCISSSDWLKFTSIQLLTETLKFCIRGI